MFRYTLAMMAVSRARGGKHRARAVALAASAVLCLLAAALLPTLAAAAPETVGDLQAQARSVRREVARLDHRAEVLTEKYDAARVALDAVNVRLQQARLDLARTQSQLDAAQALRSERLVTMYKNGGYGLLDLLFSFTDFGDADTQMGYFRSIDKADQDTLARIQAMERQVEDLTRRIDADRKDALAKEITLRGQQAAIEDELAARQRLLTDLDARVKKLLAEQAQLEAEAARRLAAEAGVDLASISGTPAQLAVVRETMKYLGVPYVWGGATPSGFDCSGLVLYVYSRFGVAFPHGATMEAHMGRPVPLSQAQPADLVFFGTPAFYHHVGIYIGNGLFIEAPHTGDVVKVSLLAGRGCTLVCRYPIRLL